MGKDGRCGLSEDSEGWKAALFPLARPHHVPSLHSILLNITSSSPLPTEASAVWTGGISDTSLERAQGSEPSHRDNVEDQAQTIFHWNYFNNVLHIDFFKFLFVN